MQKIAVYAICKNEESFAERFMRSMEGADAVYVLDTGSTDRTVEILRDFGAVVEQHIFKPWRFDDARNASLDLVPYRYNICACIDLDEVMSPGWADAIRSAWATGYSSRVNRLRYKYVWSHTPDPANSGAFVEGVTYWADKIHGRHSHFWKGAVHETMRTRGTIREEQLYAQGFQIDHWPDDSKSRSDYLPLLELTVGEDPTNDRNTYYLAREYMYRGMKEQAAAMFRRHLELPSANWDAERSRSMQYLASVISNKMEQEMWLMRACAECPGMREPWIALAWFYYMKQCYAEALGPVTRALAITERPMTYICDPGAWDYQLHDLAGTVMWKLGMPGPALEQARIAAAMNPQLERLVKNVEEMQRAMP